MKVHLFVKREIIKCSKMISLAKTQNEIIYPIQK